MAANSILPLLKQSFSEWSEDKASRLAAALAYYTAISLAPLLVLAVTIMKWLGRDDKTAIENQMGMLMGKTGHDAAVMMIDAAKNQSGVLATIISFIVLLFGASGVFAELQDSMNTIWEVQPKPDLTWWDMVKARFLSLTMVFGVIFIMLVSMIISTALAAMVTGIAGNGKVVGLTLDAILSLLVYCGIFMLLFKYLPDVKINFRDVFLGAIVTAVLFTVGKYLLTLYLKMGSTASAYGAAGSLAALLIWVYYSAQILFFGAEFTQVYARKYGSKIVPSELAVPITEERRAQQGIVRKHDLETSAQGASMLAEKRGAVYGEGLSPPRVVTITKTAPGTAKSAAIAGAGIAAGFAVGLLGLSKGRRLVKAGVEEARLQRRLDRLDARIQKLTGLAARVDAETRNGHRGFGRTGRHDPWEMLKVGAKKAVENFRTHARKG
jgi:membrane protein